MFKSKQESTIFPYNNIIMINNNNLSECEFNALYPVPYTNQNQNQSILLFPFIKIQKLEHVEEEAQVVQDRANAMMASLLKKAEQEEIVCDGDCDCDCDCDLEDDEAHACARIRLAELSRIARFSRLELEEAALDIPKLVRQTTGMVLPDGTMVYNGCPSGARLFKI
jgi:hypothetical protein